MSDDLAFLLILTGAAGCTIALLACLARVVQLTLEIGRVRRGSPSPRGPEDRRWQQHQAAMRRLAVEQAAERRWGTDRSGRTYQTVDEFLADEHPHRGSIS